MLSSSFNTFTISLYNFCGFTFKFNNIRTATLSPSRIIPISKCSVPIKSEPNFFASINAVSITLFVLGVNPKISSSPISSFLPTKASICSSICSGVIPWFSKTLLATPEPSFKRPYSKCSVPI